MAEGIVYLDVDDEITSAAQRIRSAPGTKVALVVPYGSRIATSRMNFRLLSREAVVSNRRLSIVSGDAAVRSLAASAGLPAFGTVPEYEASLVRPAEGPSAGASAAGLAASETVTGAGNPPIVSPGAPPVVAPSAVPPVVAPEPAATGRKSQRPKRPVPDETTPHDTAAWATVAAPHQPGSGDDAGTRGRRPGGRSRAPLFATLGLVGLAVVVLGVAAYLFLPSATIAVTPRRDPIGPIQLTISADPGATAVDAATSTIPADRLDVPVEAQRTFTTTGTKVKETVAGGSVTFTNYDPTSSNTIPAGSIVSTEGGIRFRTISTLNVPRANFTPPTTTVPSEASVAVQAAKPGTEGNVPANAIRVVPAGESSLFLAVHNAEDTIGGTHTETPEIKQAEIDKALAALRGDLDAAFRENIASGAGAPPGTTLFPETAVLGAAAPDPDPKTLVGQPVKTFDLKLTAQGTVIAVDPSPVATLARAGLDAQVAKDHRLIPDSIVIVPGSGTVGEDGQVTFQASARATQVAIVDAAALRVLVKGKTAAEAKAALVPYGDATVSLWPDWVATVTGVDARLTVTVDESAASGTGGPAGSPGPRPSVSPRRSGPPPSAGPPRASASPPRASAGASVAP